MSHDPSDAWDVHCAKREKCQGERLGTCPLCGWDVGDGDSSRYELVNNRHSHFHADCYREAFMSPCGYCNDWYEKGDIDPKTGECDTCMDALNEQEGIWNREPGDHNEQSE